MSTRLQHGYRLAPGTDIWAFQTALRTAMNPVRDRIDAAWLMSRAVEDIDLADRRGEPRPDLPLMRAMFAFDETQQQESAKGHAQAEMSRDFNPHAFEASFGLDPVEKGGSGLIHALVFTERREFVTLWESLPEVEPYPYWDHTDGPDDLSEAEWGERLAVWNRVLDSQPPIHSMLRFTLRAEHYDTGMLRLLATNSDPDQEPERVSLLRSNAPSARSRAMKAALEAVITEWRVQANNEPGTEDTAIKRDFLQGVWRLMRSDYSAVTDIAAHVIADHDSVVDYALTGTPNGSEPPTHPVDTVAITEAARAWLATEAGVS